MSRAIQIRRRYHFVFGSVLAQLAYRLAVQAENDRHRAAPLGHGLLRYEPTLRLQLGRLGVDPEANLLAALQGSAALGAVDQVVQVEAEARRRGLRLPSRRQADRFALTDAEQRVADLVAEGLTNKAVADRLAYSVKTIEAYLSRVYAKTGCSNRVALARHLASAAEGSGH